MTDHHEYCTGGFSPDDIVISGISGRFPHCQNVEELKEALLTSKFLLDQNNDRYEKGAVNLPFSSSGTLQDIDKFDATFFRYASTATNSTLPMQRMLLEVSYEAMVDAGYEPYSDLRGANIGVYTAVSNEDGREIAAGVIANSGTGNPNMAPGYLRCMLANRCSYCFDFRGPSYTVDTACSSSYVALHNAVHDIREGKIEAALVNSCELCLSPEITYLYAISGIVSLTAESNPFDARANGLVRSEGIAAFFVQKASQARRAYATIMAIKHIAAGYVPEGVYVPSVKEEVRLFKDILREAKLTSNDIQYVEAHGTGTQVGDPIEIKAMEIGYCEGRDKPLYTGSIKSNLGHSEASAGQIGTLKAIIAFETGLIAPNRGFETPNPNCEALVKGTIQIVKENLPLTTPYFPVNSFGFGGSLVQAMLKRNPIEYSSQPAQQDLPKLVLFPATTKAAIQFLFDYIEIHTDLRDEFFALLNKLSFTSPLWKPFRGYALYQNECPVINIKNVVREKEREVWFVMTGMGSQWPGMGLEMMRIKVFAESMRNSAAVLKPFGIYLFEILEKDGKLLTTDRSITPAFVSIAAIQIALVDTLRALEIHPDHIIGHSTGELICAYADGCCSAEQTILSSYWRGKTVESAGLEIGAMAAIGLTWEETVRRCPKGVFAACHNGEDSVTISGPKEALEKFVVELQKENIFARVVNAYGYAFHCEHIFPVSQALRAELSQIIQDPKPRSQRWISTSYVEDEWDKEDCRLAGAEYFVHNLTSVVHFSDILKKIPSDAITIEISPHFLLQAILKRSIGPEAIHIALMKRNHNNNIGFFLESLGKLYLENLNPKIENLYQSVKFPVPRCTPFISELIKWDHSQSWAVPKWKPVTTSYLHEFHPESTHSYLLDHCIDGRPLFPASGLVYLAWQALLIKLEKKGEDINVVVEHFKIHRATILDHSKSINFDVSIMNASGKFEIMGNGSLIASGKVYQEKDMKFIKPPPEINRESSTFVSGEDIYNELRICGYEYGPEFQRLVEMNFNGTEGFVSWNDNWITFIDSLLLFFMYGKEKSAFALPTGALSFKISPSILEGGVEDSLRKKLPGLPVQFYPSSNICRTMGIEIRNLEVDAAPQRTAKDNCIFEKYRFIPYVHSICFPLHENHDFVKYMIACNKIIDKFQSKVNKDLSRGKFDVESKIDFDIDSYINDIGEEHAILRTLKKLVTSEKGSSNDECFQDICSTFTRDIGKEFSNKLLVNDYSLRLLFDIISENSFRKLKVLEIENNFSIVLPTFAETVENASMLKFNTKSLVCENEDCIEKEKFSTCNIHVYMHHELASVAKHRTQGIIISAICTSTEKKAREHIRLLSSAVEEKGFILLFHKNSILPPEQLLATLAGQTVDIISLETLESWFAEEDLIIISKISDNVCGSLYLLRPSVEPGPRKIINMSRNKEWFSDLKSSAYDESKILWVVSEDCPSSGIIGMINCLRHEPGGDRIRCVFIPDASKEEIVPPLFSFDHRFFQDVLKKDLVMNVYKQGSWGSFRHIRIEKEVQKSEVEHSFVTMRKYGDLSSFLWKESALKYLDIMDDNFVHVYYSSLNFKDIMLATGKLSLKSTTAEEDSDESVLGFEVSGRNKYGERVTGASRHRGISTETEMIPETSFKIPDDWSLEEAATVPVAYGTSYYALIVRGNLQAGESILIHSGTGGVGQASINIALSMNCQIFTTVGTEEKRQYLMKKYPTIKKENIGCSRNTTFEDMIMTRTNGKGVDVVLNSLADDKFQASFRCVGCDGRFLEIGKYDMALNKKIGLKGFLRNINFQAILFDKVINESLHVTKKVTKLVIEGIRNGVVKPLDRTVFQRGEEEKAFRYMAVGAHVGKVLIKIRDEENEKFRIPQRLQLSVIPSTYFYAHKVYIIIGGLGGFGIEVSKWLLSKGARTLILTTRYGARTPYHHFCLKRWKEEGYHVTVSTRDVSIKEEAVKLLKEASKIGPVGGIFNSAVVLHDAFLENTDLASFREVCAPKADATKHLDVVSRCFCPELDHFVCFSSISCGRGNAGQMNYGYANSVMERICEQRRAEGLPGLAIQWGIIGEVGVVHRHMGDDAMIAGVRAQRVKSCLEILNLSCQLNHPVVCSYIMNDSSSNTGNQGDVLQQLARIFGLKDQSEFNTARSFREMGVDSMIGIEVKHLLETTFDIAFTTQEIQQLKLDDIKLMVEKIEIQKKNESLPNALVTTTCARLPKAIVHSKSVEPLNEIESGTPVFILDIGGYDAVKLRCLGGVIGQPAFALLLSNETPKANVPTLASWYLQKIREITPEDVHILAHRTSSAVALEMVLQSQKSPNKISKLTVLNGVSALLESINRETKRSDVDIFCDFVEAYLPSSRSKLKESLSTSTDFEKQLRAVVELFIKSSKEVVNKTELTGILASHVMILKILEEYEPKEKLNSNILVIEDSFNLLANDVAEVKNLLMEICTGKVTIQRIPNAKEFDEESVKRIASALNSVL